MQAATQIVTEFFMVVLCLYAAPSDQGDYYIDCIGPDGYMDTFIVKRVEEGFAAYDEMDGELEEYVRISSIEGKKHVYACTYAEGKCEIINLERDIVKLDSLNFKEAKRLVVKVKDGSEIRFDKSGDVRYFAPRGRKRTYVVHGAELQKKDK
jgi:hypothetical protein